MARLAIIGSSDLARLIAHHAPGCGWEVAGFIDNRAPVGAPAGDFGEVIGNIDAVEALHAAGRFEALACGVGYLQFDYRRACFERFSGRVPFASIVHPSAHVERGSQIGEGAVILPGCTIDTGVVLGDNVLLNAGVVVAHHTRIGSHSFVGPAAAIAGKVTVGESCFIGLNATIVDHRTLCGGAKIAAGAVLIEDPVRPGWYVGAPATWRKE